MKKNKGFTLIELIVAIAILAISFTGISLAFTSSSEVWRINSAKLDTSTYNQSIAHTLRGKGKDSVKEMLTHYSSFYIYFNNYDEINDAVQDEIADDLSTKTFAPTAGSTDFYSECKSKNQLDKKMGALITITNVSGSNSLYYDLFKTTITVWNLNQSSNFKTESTLYIGR